MKTVGLYHKIARIYDLLDYPSELLFYRHMRKQWINKLENEVILEIGVGTGKNLKYYKNSNTVIAVDSEIQMLIQAKRKLELSKIIVSDVNLLLQKNLPWKLPIKTFSTVIATFVFCTMDNPKPILNELLNWTKPGSKLILFEYVQSNNHVLKFFTTLINPITKKLFGFNFNRELTHDLLDHNWKITRITDIISDMLIVVEIERM